MGWQGFILHFELTVIRYEKVVILRQALGALDPRPSDEALMEGGKLYSHLVKFNRVYSYFDPRFDAVIDENGCIPDFKAGIIFNAKMESDPSPVPLFLKLFRRRPMAKECIICSSARYEIDYTDVKTWNVECEPYKGAWMWDILAFPTSEIQHCNHDFDVCKVCTAQHLRSTLESGGPNACERLSCPQCDRRLAYHEVLKLADSDTVARFDSTPSSFDTNSIYKITHMTDTRDSYCKNSWRKIPTIANAFEPAAQTASCMKSRP
jgi:hypothetical protein